jgi:hypothetical protein
VLKLLRREFPHAPEFHAPALRGVHAGAGAFADEAALKLGQEPPFVKRILIHS